MAQSTPHTESDPRPTAAPNPLEQLSLAALRTRRSAKWRAFGDDVLPLWVAEMDVPLAEPIADALRGVIDRGDTGYPAGRGYAEALAGFAERRWGWSLEVAHTSTVPDVMRGITEALKLITAPGDAVVVASPVYPPFYQYPAEAGRRVVQAPLNPAGRLDPAALEETFAEAARTSTSPAFLLSNPHNPTGVVHTRAELEQLAELADRHGLRVVADEIHAPLVLGASQSPGDAADTDDDGAPVRFTPYLSVDPRGISLMSASKGWNLAGLKAAVMIAGPDAVADLWRLPNIVAHGPSHVGALAHTAAFAHGEAWLDALLDGLRVNRTLLGELLAEHAPQVRWTPPQATYLAWLDFRRTPLAGAGDDVAAAGAEAPIRGPAKALLARAGVALTAGNPFGDGGAGHARLNMATSQGILTEAVTRIGRALS
ncbi:aminotransferase class I/II-fold pyridoxal phosphate-dependent enzyme [Nesterenkonia sp. CL21]|uniref:MalY/PatB family protein n=1 Tax=Nesterenkonia sp. CL21 TaxID=3064894 RepID=UPI002878A440|nr:aminotransferase class I/II-fold pyridoxal phosphate-dependent enzyme [Nesterenkonia sp. CL21]MDS2174293.1 aminotransferase class I/II-fold pyridoxal phosphate-dependent enzyme [Nesterenkonia sp. CL21]